MLNLKMKLFFMIIFLLNTNNGSLIIKDCYYIDYLNSINCIQKDKSILEIANLTITGLIDINLRLKGDFYLDLLGSSVFGNISVFSLDLSSNQISDFNSLMNELNNNFQELKILNLSQNLMSIINQRQFDGLVDLIVLDLSYNEIFYFTEDAFNGLNNLIELNLKKNQINEIEAHNFDNLPNLKTINLDFNKLKRIRYEVFNSLINIENISIQFNLIEIIDDDSFKELLNLKNLLLNNNKIKEFNLSLLDGLALDNLNLSYNKLKEFDPEFFYHLINLDLSNNLIERILNFSTIIKDFAAGKQKILQKLQTLNLNNNNFSSLNDTAFPFVKTAVSLTISNNSLKEFGDHFFKLSNKQQSQP